MGDKRNLKARLAIRPEEAKKFEALHALQDSVNDSLSAPDNNADTLDVVLDQAKAASRAPSRRSTRLQPRLQLSATDAPMPSPPRRVTKRRISNAPVVKRPAKITVPKRPAKKRTSRRSSTISSTTDVGPEDPEASANNIANTKDAPTKSGGTMALVLFGPHQPSPIRDVGVDEFADGVGGHEESGSEEDFDLRVDGSSDEECSDSPDEEIQEVVPAATKNPKRASQATSSRTKGSKVADKIPRRGSVSLNANQPDISNIKFVVPTGKASTFARLNLLTEKWPYAKNTLLRGSTLVADDVTLGYEISDMDTKSWGKQWIRLDSEVEWEDMVAEVIRRLKVQAASKSKKVAEKELVVRLSNLAGPADVKKSGGKGKVSKPAVTATRAYKVSAPNLEDDDCEGSIQIVPEAQLSRTNKIDLAIAEINQKYKCALRNCNGGPCYNLSPTDHQSYSRREVNEWAEDIVDGRASIERPPGRRQIKLNPRRNNHTTQQDLHAPHPYAQYYPPPMFGPYPAAHGAQPWAPFIGTHPTPATSSTPHASDEKLDFPLISDWLTRIDATDRNRDGKNYSDYIPVFRELKIFRMGELLSMASCDLANMSGGQIPFGIANDLVRFAKHDVIALREAANGRD